MNLLRKDYTLNTLQLFFSAGRGEDGGSVRDDPRRESVGSRPRLELRPRRDFGAPESAQRRHAESRLRLGKRNYLYLTAVTPVDRLQRCPPIID